MNKDRFNEITEAITEAREHLYSVGDGRGARIMDAALQEWSGGSLDWGHVEALDSAVREHVTIPVDFKEAPF
jgi:hypothetical protein